MGALILVMTNTIGLNINHTVSVILQCFIVAHLLGYSTNNILQCCVGYLVTSNQPCRTLSLKNENLKN